MIIDALTILATPETVSSAWALPGEWIPGPALKGYRTGWHHTSGLIMSFDQYGVIEQSVAIKSSGPSVSEMMKIVTESDRVTRVDVAFDIETFSVSEVYGMELAGRVSSEPAFKSAIVGSDHGVETMYYGRRDGHCMVRVYDKIKEQKAKGNNCEGLQTWTRIEYECKKDFARLVWQLYKLDQVALREALCQKWRIVVDFGPARIDRREIWPEFASAVSSSYKRATIAKKEFSLVNKLEFARRALGSVRFLAEVEGMAEVIQKLLVMPLTKVQKLWLSQLNYSVSDRTNTRSQRTKAAASSITLSLQSRFRTRTGLASFQM